MSEEHIHVPSLVKIPQYIESNVKMFKNDMNDNNFHMDTRLLMSLYICKFYRIFSSSNHLLYIFETKEPTFHSPVVNMHNSYCTDYRVVTADKSMYKRPSL